MKTRAFGAAALCALLAALTASAALAGNPHGTPPGQAKQDNTTTAQAQASSSQSASQPAATPNPSSHYAGCSASSAQSDGKGVKPSNSTKHNTCTTVGTADTKEYGNGKTAGQIAMSRGAATTTPIYGPGNSQPHKVEGCKNGKGHFVDVHAVKSYAAGACAPATQQSSSSSASVSTSGSDTGCSASSAQSNGKGVKPNNNTKHDACAAAGSADTKLYGNGKTAGQIAMSHGASATTTIYGPGNSQPHKVAVCKNGKTHYVDVHAVKSYSAGACAPAAQQSSSASSSNQSSASQSTASNTASASQSTSSNTSSSSSSTSSNVSSSVTSGTAPSTSSNVSSSSTSPPAANTGVLGATHTHAATSPAVHHAAKPKIGVLGASHSSSPSKPASGVLGTTAHSGQLPFTGVSLWVPALSALFALGLGLAARRYAQSKA